MTPLQGIAAIIVLLVVGGGAALFYALAAIDSLEHSKDETRE